MMIFDYRLAFRAHRTAESVLVPALEQLSSTLSQVRQEQLAQEVEAVSVNKSAFIL